MLSRSPAAFAYSAQKSYALGECEQRCSFMQAEALDGIHRCYATLIGPPSYIRLYEYGIRFRIWSRAYVL